MTTDNSSKAVLLFGASNYRYYEQLPNAERSITLIKIALENVYGKERVRIIVNEKFSRPKVLFDGVDYLAQSGCKQLVVYFWGHVMNRWDKKIFFAQPTSHPKRTSTHISISKLIEIFNNYPWMQIVFIADTEPFSPDVEILRQSKNMLFIFRRLKKSGDTWKNGGEMFSGTLADTLLDMFDAIPAITFHHLFTLIAHRLGYAYAKDCISYYGNQDLSNNHIYLQARNKGVWNSDRRNLESQNRGSREDGIQAVVKGLISLDTREEAISILEFLAATDPAEEVRYAAKGALSFATQSNFEILAPLEGYPQITEVLPDWLMIEEGEFLMGSDPLVDKFALPEEMPQHKVWLPRFWIAKYPVSRKEWNHFLKASNFLKVYHDNNIRYDEYSNLPITNVNLYEAVEYTKWLTYQLHIQGIIRPEEEIRLPSEAEWEKAARGVEGKIYPWGNEFRGDYCNYEANSNNQLIEIGTLPPEANSPYGVSEMVGNSWEWTISLWGKGGHKPDFKYPYVRNDGRENQSADKEIRRVVRGGAFYYLDYCLRAATRNVMYPVTRHSGGGFRLIRAQKK